jgi:hypothetical protein
MTKKVVRVNIEWDLDEVTVEEETPLNSYEEKRKNADLPEYVDIEVDEDFDEEEFDLFDTLEDLSDSYGWCICDANFEVVIKEN